MNDTEFPMEDDPIDLDDDYEADDQNVALDLEEDE
jgi:hypothetical protein